VNPWDRTPLNPQSARKAYVTPSKAQRCDPVVMEFSDVDYAEVSLSHTNALVVSMTVANF
jgi:hypothetical protein